MISKIKIILLFFTFNISLLAFTINTPIVSTKWVDTHKQDIIILDVQKGVNPFKKSIKGAVVIDWKKVRVNKEVNGKVLIDMIPSKKEFNLFMQKLGVNNDSNIVITSSGRSISSVFYETRLYWQLKYYGHDSVAILDGGNAQWSKEKREMEIPLKPKKGNFQAKGERKELLADMSDIKRALKYKLQLIDARDESQYLGLFHKSYVFKYGHLPNAKFLDASILVSHEKIKKFLPLKTLKKIFDIKKIDYTLPTITYCNSGYIASSIWFIVHELLGNKDIKLYDASMHEWTFYKKNLMESL